MYLKATEVFVPGGYPTYTYVERSDVRIEQRLRDGLEDVGKFVSISGPSKSGKTVLIEKVVGKDNLIPITGGGISNAEEVWDRVLDWIDVPLETSIVDHASHAVGGEAETKISGKVPLIAEVGGGFKGTYKHESGRETQSVRRRRGLTQVIDEIANSSFIVLLDDFHYISDGVQVEVMRQIKEAARLGVKICVASVLHRADAAIRANTEMQGRFVVVDLNYWDENELKKIAEQGFRELNVNVPVSVIERFATEAAGSPQLMQTICLQSCRNLGHRERTENQVETQLDHGAIGFVLQDSANSIDFRSLVDILDCGPKERGRERKLYQFTDGTSGDVYRCILRSISLDPPRLSFDYDELMRRASTLCDGESPTGSSLQGSCDHMIKLARTKFPNERAIDWNREREILDVPDPYLLYYLRWSDRLAEPNH